MPGWIRRLLAAAGALGLAACLTTDAPKPATLTHATPEAINALKSMLAEAMGRTRIELGPGDLTRETVVTVLPLPIGPHESNSMSLPTRFDVLVYGKRCYLRREGSDALLELRSVSCRAAGAVETGGPEG
jgi:hypothetical protein